jgi:hypothetical protein
MKRRLRRVVFAALWLGLWTGAAGVAYAAPADVAKASSTGAKSTFTRDGKTAEIGPTTELQQSDVVRVPENGRLKIEFADKSSVALVGPATTSLVEMSDKGRRMMLVSGSISEATVGAAALEIQAPDSSNASVVLQNSRGSARVNPGDKIVFQKLGGAYGKVYTNGKGSDLGDAPWVLNVRSGAAAQAAPEQAPASPAARPPGKKPFLEMRMEGKDRAVITNGVKPIVFYPASSFTRERTQDGQGFRITFEGGDDEWGVVEIGRETTLFVAQGESIEFDSDGTVTRFSGVAHEYHPLFDAISEDPIRDASDASPSFSRHR